MIWLPLLIALGVGGRPSPDVQVLVVTSESWGADRATAVLFEHGEPVLGPFAVRLGHAGLGWGRGLHPADHPKGPAKVEGDGRSPAGVFRIGPAWTRAFAARAWCVDDPASKDYARIVTLAPGEKPRWSSDEHMADYRVAIVVEHNPERVRKGGSCIFLHDGGDPTVGCTAFDPTQLDAMRSRLRHGARIVQLPRPVYRRVAPKWRLPRISSRR